MSKYKLLSVGADAKTIKGQKQGVLTGILYLLPAAQGGGKSLCPFSSAGCRSVCLVSAGRGAMQNVHDARMRKTQWWLNDPAGFKKQLAEDVSTLVKEATTKGMIPAVRANGTSDILWHREGLIDEFPDVQHYNYTKNPARLFPNPLPPNYHITYSFSEAKHAPQWSDEWYERGVNTAAVFNGGLPDTFRGKPVIDGDLSDLRFTDPVGVIVGLKAKGKARGVVDAGTGFVQLGKVAA